MLFFHADSLANISIIFPLNKFLLKIKLNLFLGKSLGSLERYVMIRIGWYQWATVIPSNGQNILGLFSLSLGPSGALILYLFLYLHFFLFPSLISLHSSPTHCYSGHYYRLG